MKCPHPDCGAELEGLGTYCHACQRYTDERAPRREGPSAAPSAPGPVKGITLPLPPSANDISRSIARIKGTAELRAAIEKRDWDAVRAAFDKLEAFVSVVTSREGKLWADDVADWLTAQGPDLLEKGVPASVRATFYFANDRRDLDNAIKPLLDVLQGRCFANDRQVRHIEVWKLFDADRPRTELVVEPLTRDAAPRLRETFQFKLDF